jgi:UDP-N-acetylmuramoyl-tripeptide--D-alanyl-D-alanine ligase
MMGYKRRNEFLWKMNVRYWKPMLHVAQAYRATLARYQRVVAVTGTFGKTTTTRAVKAALGVHLHPWTDLNANCLSLVPMALMRQSPFRKYAVVEVGIDGPWQMERYAAAIQPDIVVMTSIGNEHIQSFKNLHHLRHEKAEMVRALSVEDTAILNGDDPNVMWMATQTEAQIITFGFAPHCNVFASDVRLDWPNGTRLTLNAKGDQITLRVQLIGEKMIYPLIAAAAVAIANERSLHEVTAALEALPPTPGRLQPMHLPNNVIVLRDDYKSTVDTIHTALDVLKQVETGRRIVVLGDIDSPPSPARPYYRAIGERVAGISDIAIFVGKKFKDYRSGARRGGMINYQMRHARNIHEAIDILQDEVQARDVILVKGQEKQRLTRIVLALAGQKICCRVDLCQLHLMFCDYCPMLDRNWNDA